jgi:hypothetical protein
LLALCLLILPTRLGWVRFGGSLLLPALVLIVIWEFSRDQVLDRARNFFGVVSVLEERNQDDEVIGYQLMHGRIMHGCQFADPARRREVTSYYGPGSGVRQAIEYLQEFDESIRVGVVGLGAGTVAACARPGDVFRFYEINPAVVRMALEDFTYLQDCQGTYDIVMATGGCR